MKNSRKSKDPFKILERTSNVNFELFFLEQNVILLYKNDNMVLRYTKARHVVNVPNDCIYIHDQSKGRYKIPNSEFDTFYYCVGYKTGKQRIKNIISRLERTNVYELDYKTLYRRFNYNWRFDGVDSIIRRFDVINSLFDVKRFTPKINLDEHSENYLKPYWELNKREKGSLVLG